MATSVTVRNPGWCDGLTMAAEDIRLVDISALLSGSGGPAGSQIGVGSGVRDATGSPLQVSVATGMSVTVNPGFGLVQSTTAANAGTYSVCVDTPATITCQTADLVNPRIDLVCVTVFDNGDDTSNAVVQVVSGTAAPVPSPPALPDNSFPLCQITVAANATSLVSGNLTDTRTFAVAAGGIQPVISAAQYPTVGGAAMYLHNIATHRLVRMNGAGQILAPSTALFAPVTATGSATASSTTFQTIASGSVTTDGLTPVKVSLKFSSIGTSSASVGSNCTIQLTRDGTAVDSIVKWVSVANQSLDGGSVMIPDTPSAGTHTYAWRIANGGAGSFALHVGVMLIEASSP